MPLFGVELLGQFHRTLHVGEKHCDLLALALQGALGSKNLVGDVLGRVVARVAGGARLDVVAHNNRIDLRFGFDAEGEILIMSQQDGVIRRLAPAPNLQN